MAGDPARCRRARPAVPAAADRAIAPPGRACPDQEHGDDVGRPGSRLRCGNPRYRRPRSRALAFNVTALAALTGLTVAVAIRASWQWPFAVILGVTGLGHLFGLSAYGIAEEGPADDANAERQTPFPISRRPAAETRLNTQTHQAPAQNIPSCAAPSTARQARSARISAAPCVFSLIVSRICDVEIRERRRGVEFPRLQLKHD